MITLERGGPQPLAFLVVELRDVLVTRVDAGWRANLPDEEVSLSFAQVCWTYRRQNPDGTPGPPTRFCFDVRNNRPA